LSLTTMIQREVSLRLTGNPRGHAKARTFTPKERSAYFNWQQEALSEDWIERAPPWVPVSCAPLFVPKKTPGELRFCIDFRPINAHLDTSVYAPRSDRALRSNIQQHTWFRKIDLKNAFFQIRLQAADRWLTTFRGPDGLWCFKVLPQGLAPAPGLFQQYIEQLLGDFLGDNVTVHIDDILIHTSTKRQCIALSSQVEKVLQTSGLHTNDEKSTPVSTVVDYCGYHYEGGRSVPIGKTESIKEWPQPRNVTELRKFLGSTVHFRDAIPRYAVIAQPLYECTGKVWRWSSTQDRSFCALKQAVCKLVESNRYTSDEHSQMTTDASLFGVSAYLVQNQRVIAVWSRALKPAERNYTADQRELLAVVNALEVWEHMLETSPGISVYTDNMINATNIKATTNNRRKNRWILTLARFKLTWHHTPGMTNIADALSRRPDYNYKEGGEERT
jgi:hypothetical protein